MDSRERAISSDEYKTLLGDVRSMRTKSYKASTKSKKKQDVPWSRLIDIKRNLPASYKAVMMGQDMELLLGSDSSNSEPAGGDAEPIFFPKDFEKSLGELKIQDYRLTVNEQQEYGKRLTALRQQFADKAQ